MTKIETSRIEDLADKFEQFLIADAAYKQSVTNKLDSLSRGIYGDLDNDSKGLKAIVADHDIKLKSIDDLKLKGVGFLIGAQLIIFAMYDKISELVTKIFH